MNRPAWFVATLLAMLAVLMAAQLQELSQATAQCEEWGRILFEHAKQQSRATGRPPVLAKESISQECLDLEQEYRETADQYLQLILALLGGAGLAGGMAARSNSRPGDTSPPQDSSPPEGR